MNCQSWHKQIMKLASGGLDSRKTDALHAHLAGCPACRARWDGEQALQKRLDALRDRKVTAPDDFNRGVWEKISQTGPEPAWQSNRVRFLPVAVVLLLTVVAGAAVIFRMSDDSKNPKESRIVHAPAIDPARLVASEEVGSKQIEEKASGISDSFKQESGQNLGQVKPIAPVRHIVQAVPPVDDTAEKLIPEQPVERHQQTNRTVVAKGKPVQADSKGSEADVFHATSGEGDGSVQPARNGKPALRDLVIRQNKIRPSQGEKTRVTFVLTGAGMIRAAVFSKEGRRVRELESRWFESGGHAVEWDGLDQQGRPCSSGVYLLVLDGDIETQRIKLLLVR